MTIIEILLIIVGVGLCVGSFVVSEKLSGKDRDNLQNLTEDQISEIIKDKMADARVEMEDILSERIDEAMEELDRKTDKETNDKIMNISEYSDTVLKSINQSHDEVMFMYSMLNEKQADVTEMTKDLVAVKDSIVVLDSKVSKKMDMLRDKETALEALSAPQAPVQQPEKEFVPLIQESFTEKLAAKFSEDVPSNSANNSNLEILTLHDEGLTEVEIAKKLGRGLGEVKFVLGLYQEG